MRFCELITELSRPSRDKAEHMLVKAGYRQLGRGVSGGAVFQKPGASYVLKLFDARDEAYLTFVRLASRNHNPHFPKFFGKPIRITDNYFAVRTEPLQPSTNLEEVEIIDRYIIAKRDNMNGWWRPEFEYFSDKSELREACDLIAMMLRQSGHDFICDVHLKNVMMRGSVLVLSDPVAMN